MLNRVGLSYKTMPTNPQLHGKRKNLLPHQKNRPQLGNPADRMPRASDFAVDRLLDLNIPVDEEVQGRLNWIRDCNEVIRASQSNNVD